MAYCYSEKTEAARLAVQVARRDSIIAAAIDAIKKYGIEIGIREVAERGKFSLGLIYKEFPDVPELKAAAFAQLLAADRAALLSAAEEEKDPRQALCAALTALFARMVHPLLVHAMVGNPVYEKGMRNEIERLISAAVDAPKLEVKHAARATLGALASMSRSHGLAQDRSQAAVLFALRGIGMTETQARRVLA